MIADAKSRRNDNALAISTFIVGSLLLGMDYLQEKYNPLFLSNPEVPTEIRGIR